MQEPLVSGDLRMLTFSLSLIALKKPPLALAAVALLFARN
jgi:hypothetical protein